jgi:hypothetical protein
MNQPQKSPDPSAAGDAGKPEKSAGARGVPAEHRDDATGLGVCPVCGGPLEEVRAELQCRRCHAIIETCCEGGPQ